MPHGPEDAVESLSEGNRFLAADKAYASTDPAVLTRLAKEWEHEPGVMIEIAANPHTPPAILERLTAYDPDHWDAYLYAVKSTAARTLALAALAQGEAKDDPEKLPDPFTARQRGGPDLDR